MKMVHGNAVFIREEAKLARLTDMHFQRQTSPLSTPIKAGTYRGAERFAFSQR